MSMVRNCDIYLADTGDWYLDLGDFESAEVEDSTSYGPFECEEDVHTELSRHSSPGHATVDASGERPAPVVSPNGMPLHAGYSGLSIKPARSRYRG